MDFGKRTEAAFLDLERWIDKNGWAGYDPYDIKGQAWYVISLVVRLRFFGNSEAFSS